MIKKNITIVISALFYFHFSAISSEINDKKFKEICKKYEISYAILYTTNKENIEQEILYYADNIPKKVVINQNSIFQTSSIGKIIGGVLFRILEDEGILRGSDFVKKWIPNLKSDKITLMDLLAHSSGIDDSSSPKDGILSPKEYVKNYASYPQKYPPGKVWRYSYTHEILGDIISTHFKRPLADIFYEKVFAPLGMKDSSWNPTSEQKQNTLDIMHFIDKSTINQIPTSVLFESRRETMGDGAYVSIKDYLTLLRFLLNEGKNEQGKQVLKKESIREMFKPYISYKVKSKKDLMWGKGTQIDFSYGMASLVYEEGFEGLLWGWASSYGPRVAIDLKGQKAYLLVTHAKEHTGNGYGKAFNDYLQWLYKLKMPVGGLKTY